MQLQQYIKELLFRHECVTVPHFGAFLTRSIHVLIQTDTGVFTPPRKEVSFNHLLKSNDGILAHYMAQKENVSYEQALRKIEKEVIIWRQRLNTQHLTFAGIGEMRLNPQKKISFSPFGAINFDLNSFGLSSFIRKSIFTPPINTEEHKHIPIMENENKRNYWKTEEENLLKHWADKAQCYQWMHSRSHNVYSRKNALFTIPVIIISTITGTANFAQDRFPDNIKAYVVMSLSLIHI